MKSLNPKIILASSSPRRKELLERVVSSIRVITPNVDESRRPGEALAPFLRRVSLEKARSVYENVKTDPVVIIAADTVVVYRNQVLGKPKGHSDALKTLKLLSGKTHRVLTSYSIISQKKKVTRVITSRVWMRSYSLREIRGYLLQNESMDKAGAYGIQGAGAALVARVEGSYTNIVGLPLAEVVQDLQKNFGMSIWTRKIREI